MKVVIIIPTYNERKNIGRLIDTVQPIIKDLPKKFDVHLLIVDDSSPDGTAQVVKDKQKSDKNIHLLSNPEKAGLGGAYLKGMEYATKKLSADVMMEFDADFSHDPQRIPAFLEKIDQGYDMVLGSRYIPGGTIPENWGLHRKFLSYFGNWIIRIVMTYFSIHDWTTGYRAIRSTVYEAIKAQMDEIGFRGYTFQIGFLHKTIRKGFKVTEVPIDFIDRTEGESKLGPEYVKNTLLYIFRIRFHEILHSRFMKFAVVGGTGLVLQTVLFEVLGVWTNITTPAVATIIGGQIAVISNYLLNNLWTFKDRQITTVNTLAIQFIKFWLTSNVAVIVLQGGTVKIGEILVGTNALYIQLFYIFGLVATIIWNYTIYNRYIWKKAK